MHVGILTAPFARDDLKTVVDFAADAGFASLELTCVPGCAHLDPQQYDAAQVTDTVAAAGLQISSLACYVDVTHGDPVERQANRDALRRALDACAAMKVDTLCCIAGRPPEGKSREDTIRDDASPFFNELCRDAAADGIQLAMENWFATNIQHLGHWDLIFETCPADNFGLNFDPSHLYWMGIDHLYAVEKFASRIFHTHAKDTEIRRHVLAYLGNQDHSHWRYVIPGYGEIDWGVYIARLRDVGYNGVLSIEHEDRAFGREEGFIKGLRHLSQFC
ncbi:MAG: sugar phosphate isomerase/epimerase [candidate division WS1 bacterium]|jgi:sugar phosphate isomerase/epimerase|nr:sugar phosphate isomerase/epimerase [candidate division WS1 bacterium]